MGFMLKANGNLSVIPSQYYLVSPLDCKLREAANRDEHAFAFLTATDTVICQLNIC